MSLWRLWAAVVAPFGLGYFMSYLLRAVNAVVVEDLERDIGVSAEGLGLITAAYLFGFGAFQLPLGVLLDRFGPRRVQACLLMVSAIGAFLFSLGESMEMLVAARLLIGLGFAGGLMASFKAVVLWAPPPRVPLFNALVMVFGGFGVLAATEPAHMAVASFGWRAVFVGLGGDGCARSLGDLPAGAPRAAGHAESRRFRGPACRHRPCLSRPPVLEPRANDRGNLRHTYRAPDALGPRPGCAMSAVSTRRRSPRRSS